MPSLFMFEIVDKKGRLQEDCEKPVASYFSGKIFWFCAYGIAEGVEGAVRELEQRCVW